MGKGGCMNGELDTTLYSSPVPFIGLYIAAATLVCFFCMTFDLVHGFIRKKPFLPCKLFPINSFTLTVLAVATKIPLDLTTSMPRTEDQLSKLMGTALLCTSLGFYMPSLGTMGASERFGNMAALSVMVITMVVNVCIQMGTVVIHAFMVEHIIIMVCTLVLLLFMWSSAVAFRGQTEGWETTFRSRISEEKENAKKCVQGLRKLLLKLHVINYTGNPQGLLCETTHHHVFGLLCGLSSAVVLQAMIRSFVIKDMRLYCSGSGSGGGVSDYRWSIPVIIVAQFLTIAVGTLLNIYRWLSLLKHTTKSDLRDPRRRGWFQPEQELEYMRWKILPIRFLSKRKNFLNAKNLIMDVLISTQILLYDCSCFFIGYPIYIVKTVLKFIIETFYRIFFHDHQHTDDKKDDIEKMLEEEMSISNMSEIVRCALSTLCREPFDEWIVKMGMKDMIRWRNTNKRDRPTQLIQLISNKCLASASASASKSESALFFMSKLEDKGKEFVEMMKEKKKARDYEFEYEYRVSCLSVLVLSGMLAELMPSPSSSSRSSRESILQSLNESFEIIYYVDQRATDTPGVDDKIRWTAAMDVWAQWDNPHHWFRTQIISPAFKKESKEYSKLDQLHLARRVAYDVMERHISVQRVGIDESLAKKHEALIGTEFLVICDFILQEQEHESTTDLFDFLEKFFAEMLYFILSRLPRAILKEIDGDDPTEIGEERVKKALKFFCNLEQLENTIEWSWPETFKPESKANVVVHSQSPLMAAAPDCGCSEVEASNISNAIDGKVGKSDAFLAAAACATGEEDNDDEIKEIGSNEIV